jgi:hypothetical protein
MCDYFCAVKIIMSGVGNDNTKMLRLAKNSVSVSNGCLLMKAG